MRALALVALAACRGVEPGEQETEPLTASTGSGTGGDTGEEPVASAFCVWDGANELRILCEVSLPEAAAVEVRFTIPGEGTRTVASVSPAVRHQLRLWDLPADTPIAWEAGPPAGEGFASGEVRTGLGPPRMGLQFLEDVSGPSVVERLFFPWSCSGSPFLLVTDAQGRPRWYEPLSSGTVKGIDVSDRGTFLVVPSRTRVYEIAPTGERVLGFAPDTPLELPHPVHHDVVARHGQTLVLNARTVLGTDGEAYVSDGLFSLSDSGTQDVWHLAQAFDPTGLPEPRGYYWFGASALQGIDFGHANSIDVRADGTWLLSFKHLDTVMAVVGDPLASNRGEILWELAGGDLAAPRSPLNYSGPPEVDATFQFPHHARWVDDHALTVVDNGRGDDVSARVLHIAVDAEAGTADLVRTWALEDQVCPIQSSAFLLGDGSLLAFCTSERILTEFDPEGAVRRRLRLACPTEGLLPLSIPRVYPLAAFGNGRPAD